MHKYFDQVCNEHDKLVLEYFKAEAEFREGFSSSVSESDFKRRKKKRAEAFRELNKFENTLLPNSLDQAYKKCRRKNRRKTPGMNPYERSSEGDEAAYEGAKGVLRQYYDDFIGRELELTIDKQKMPLYISLCLSFEGQELMSFYFAPAFEAQGEQQKPSIILFSQWQVPAEVAQKAAPDLVKDFDRRYTMPLAKQKADETSLEALLDWVGTDLIGQYFQAPLENWEEIKKEAKELITGLSANIRLLGVEFPEIIPMLG